MLKSVQFKDKSDIYPHNSRLSIYYLWIAKIEEIRQDLAPNCFRKLQ